MIIFIDVIVVICWLCFMPGFIKRLCTDFMKWCKMRNKKREWQKQKDDICTGNEVIYHDNKYVVCYIEADKVYHIIDRNWNKIVV